MLPPRLTDDVDDDDRIEEDDEDCRRIVDVLFNDEDNDNDGLRMVYDVDVGEFTDADDGGPNSCLSNLKLRIDFSNPALRDK